MDIKTLGAMIRGMSESGHVFRFSEHEFVVADGVLKNIANRFSVPLAHLPLLSDEQLAQRILYNTPYELPEPEQTPEPAQIEASAEPAENGKGKKVSG